MKRMKKNLRFNIDESLHKKIVKIQGLYSFKESDKVSIEDTYNRILERGVAEIMKNNKG